MACDEYYESRIENAKKALAEEMQRKEDEMRQKFVAKVREKEASLRFVPYFFLFHFLSIAILCKFLLPFYFPSEREEALNAKRQQMVEEIEKMRRQLDAERF